MDDRILYNPDNRYLASSSSNDFSLYGAPADPALWFAPAAAPSVPAEAAASLPIAEAPAEAEPGRTADALPPSGAGSAPPTGSDSAAAPASILPVAEFAEAPPSAAPSSTPLAPFAPGFAAPPAAGRAAEIVSSEAPAAQPAAATEFVTAFAPAPSGAVAAAPAPPGAVAAAPAAVPTVALAGDMQDAIGPAITGPLSDVLPGELPAAVEESVTDLLGSDPAGGIATLVSLVTISEVLDLKPDTAVGEDAIVASAPSVIDALASDALGETAPADAEPEEAVDGLITIPVPAVDVDLPGGLG